MLTAAEALELPILDQAQVVAGRGSLKQIALKLMRLFNDLPGA